MLHKFTTTILNVAFNVRTRMAADYRACVENDVQALLHLYSVFFSTGKRDEIMSVINTLCQKAMAERMISLTPEAQAALGITVARTETQKCSRCGGNHDASIH